MPEVTEPVECAKHQWVLLKYDKTVFQEGGAIEVVNFCCPNCESFKDVIREFNRN